MGPFRILCTRSEQSRFGWAQAWLKNAAGDIVEFATREAADAECSKIRGEIESPNVSYRVEQVAATPGTRQRATG